MLKFSLISGSYVVNGLISSWFHGKITREKAEELLVPRENGLFLVRESHNFQGDYTLTVWYVLGDLCCHQYT